MSRKDPERSGDQGKPLPPELETLARWARAPDDAPGTRVDADPDVEKRPANAHAGPAAEDVGGEEDARPTDEYERVGPAPDQLAAPEETASAAPADERAPTALYHAAKPRPKAVPISEVGRSELDELDEAEQRAQARRDLRMRVAWIVAAAALTGMLAVVGVIRARQQPQGMGGADQPQPDRVAMAPAHGDQGSARSPGPARRRPRDEPPLDDQQDEPTTSAARGKSRMKFERRGHAIVVPARVTGPAGVREVTLVFDTGATFSTLDSATLQALGVRPTVAKSKVATANGVVSRPLAIVEGIQVGGAGVDGGLTVGVCDRCAATGTQGLLGLNFSRHFMVIIDHQAGALSLSPKRLSDPKVFDIRPFVKLIKPRSRRGQGKVVIHLAVRNLSSRPLRGLVLGASSDDHSQLPPTTIAHLAAGAQRDATITGPAGPGKRTFTVMVLGGQW